MARKKLSPVATFLTLAGIGLTGFLIYKYVYQPIKAKRLAPQPGNLETDFVEIVDQNQA